MTIARSLVYFIGTGPSEGTAWTLSSGDTIANNATDTGSEVDVLGGDAAVGDGWFYLNFTSTVTAGTLDLTINTTPHSGAFAKLNAQRSFSPINGTQKICLGRYPVSRFMNVTLKNNATGASVTNACVFCELEKLS